MSNPTFGSTQFNNPIHLDGTLNFGLPFGGPNPTFSTTQFTVPIHLDNILNFGITLQPNPTLDTTQFNNPIHLDGTPNFGIPLQPNPTQDTTQFSDPIHDDDIPNFGIPLQPNPTQGNSSRQFNEPFPPTRGKQFEDYLSTQLQQLNPTNNVDWSVANSNSDPPGVWAYNNIEDKTPVDNRQYALDVITSANPLNTNLDESFLTKNLITTGLGVAAGFTGAPVINQAAAAISRASTFGNQKLSGAYKTLPFDSLTNKFNFGVKYPDFRARFAADLDGFNDPGEILGKFISLADKPVNGTYSALVTNSGISKLYAGASISQYGAYSLFNRETIYGTGDHDLPGPWRQDFTLRSQAHKEWIRGLKGGKGDWAATINPVARLVPFRGDKINVIDFGQRRKQKAIYSWKNFDLSFGANIPGVGDNTKDFVKFYFTGPKLYNGRPEELLTNPEEEDVIVFRAMLTSLSDTGNASWTPQNMVGRADPNYIYGGYSRDVSVGFSIYATDRDELKPIYRKLNALLGYLAPNYNTNNIGMEGPWLRVTIGDLFIQQPVVLSSLSYAYDVTAAPWEINIESDPTNKQVPLKIDVTATMNMITDYVPQKGGRFYTLAEKFDKNGQARTGGHNWLSDFANNTTLEEAKQKKDRNGFFKRYFGKKVKSETNDGNKTNADQLPNNPPPSRGDNTFANFNSGDYAFNPRTDTYRGLPGN